MEFKKYPSIENAYQIKRVAKINNKIFEGEIKDEFVVTEKIHGANISFHVTETEIQVASRTRFLDDYRKFTRGGAYAIEYFILKCKELRETVFNFDFILYGEVFGGDYPHKDVPVNMNASKVQKGVYYTPNVEIIAFDVFNKDTGKFVAYDEKLLDIFKEQGIPYAKPLLVGTLEECLQYPNDFCSGIYKEYNLPEIQDNICEGVVIKPVEAVYIGETRIILKNKNNKFTERNKSVKIPVKYSSKMMEAMAVAKEYVTEARLNNVLSHDNIQLEEYKQIGIVMPLFIEDIMQDFNKEYEGEPLDKEELKSIRKKISPLCVSLIKKKINEGM